MPVCTPHSIISLMERCLADGTFRPDQQLLSLVISAADMGQKDETISEQRWSEFLQAMPATEPEYIAQMLADGLTRSLKRWEAENK